MLTVSSKVAAAQRSRLITSISISNPRSSIWTSWNQAKSPNARHNLTLKRNYIFFPSTIDDMLKLIKSQSSERGRIMVKLSTRWHDQLGTVLDRYDKLLRRTSSQIISNVKSPLVTQPGATSKTTLSKYKSLKSWGMSRLMTHYNAKKRVFARRDKTFKSLRRMNATEAKLYREQYYNSKKVRLSQALNRLRLRVDRKREEVREWLLNGSRIKAIAASDYDKTTTGGTAKWKSLTLTEPAKQSWFDAEGYPLTSREETGRFVNPWQSQSTNGENGLKKFLQWKAEKIMKKLGLDGSEDASSTLNHGADEWNQKPIYRQDTWPYIATAPFATAAEDTIKLAWLGHATTLVKFPGDFTILTDPHFSSYAGPMKRNDPPPVSVPELPEIDCVLISHDHMDHLDYWSILELVDSNKAKYWVVPLGIKDWLINKAGICPDVVVELEWWEGVRVSKDVVGSDGRPQSPKVEGLIRAFDKSKGKALNNNESTCANSNEMIITCAPAQHWCSRSPFDRNRRLWCSYAVHATPAAEVCPDPKTHSFYFAGDTGLPPEFPLHHQIGDRLGPFDLAAIPIGAYEPRWFMKYSHCDPAEAVEIHQAIRSRRSVAIHFDTFNLADEPQAEPPRLLVEEVKRVNDKIGRLAAEVVAVADEVNVVVGKDTASPSITQSEMFASNDHLLSSHITDTSDASNQSKDLVEIPPPLVDFAVIKQGHFIESLPNKIKC